MIFICKNITEWCKGSWISQKTELSNPTAPYRRFDTFTSADDVVDTPNIASYEYCSQLIIMYLLPYPLFSKSSMHCMLLCNSCQAPDLLA